MKVRLNLATKPLRVAPTILCVWRGLACAFWAASCSWHLGWHAVSELRAQADLRRKEQDNERRSRAFCRNGARNSTNFSRVRKTPSSRIALPSSTGSLTNAALTGRKCSWTWKKLFRSECTS